MRSITISIAFILSQLLLCNPVLAEGYDDCRSTCSADKATRVADCPSPYDSTNGGHDRDECLKASQESYASCIESCPPPPPPPEPESGMPSVSY